MDMNSGDNGLAFIMTGIMNQSIQQENENEFLVENLTTTTNRMPRLIFTEKSSCYSRFELLDVEGKYCNLKAEKSVCSLDLSLHPFRLLKFFFIFILN